jgi:hypothetical protein
MFDLSKKIDISHSFENESQRESVIKSRPGEGSGLTEES